METTNKTTTKKVAIASLIGTTIEFYDFYIYGIAAALVFKQVFFPNLDAVTGTIAAFASFGVGFISRPIGAVVFGHYGDRIGRKAMLVASLTTMGIATVIIGLLPSYQTIGIWAPLLLCFLRFLQGFGLGGEWGGATLIATEYAPEGKRGLFGALPQLGSAPGFLLSNAIFLILSFTLHDRDFLEWGWRIPFLLSALLIAFGLYIRLSIEETPVFRHVKSTVKVPVIEVLKNHYLQVILGGFATAITYVLFFITSTYCLTYGVEILNLSRTTMLLLTMIAVIAMGISTLYFGALSDRFGRSQVIIVSAIAAGIWGMCFFPLLDTQNLVVIGVAMSVTLAIMGGVFGPMGAYLPELFAPRIRYTGAALAYSMGGIFGGAFSPIIAAKITSHYGSDAIGWYIALMAMLSIIAVSLLYNRRPKSFNG
ncbi:MFS transporter [Brucellaceae bacterium C25G]